MTLISFLVGLVAFVVVGGLLGGFLSGLDRKISARMQHRIGPSVFQSFYDVAKLFSKEKVGLNGVQDFYILMALLLAVLSGAFFFAGGNLLLVIFTITLSSLFFVLAGYSTRSPYAEIGAEREIVQVMSYEPMVLLMAVGYYMCTGTFYTYYVAYFTMPLVAVLPLIFIGFVFILTIKLRKSPFDLSYSHHAHQELVKGISTEMSGATLARVEIMHWYENVLFLGWVALFLVWGGAGVVGWVVGIVCVLVIWFLEILIDNTFARVKWQAMLKWAWLVALILSVLNIVALYVAIYVIL